MNVRRLVLANFGSHQRTEVELPERGLVVVQGHNGSGKSSLLEAVSVACWGKTLRGAALWLEGAGGVVKVDSDVVFAERGRSASGKVGLGFEPRDPADLAVLRLRVEAGEDVEHETATKAQERLEALVGPHEVWKRTSVLSSADAAHFSSATDAERKALLETVLGIDRFEAALVSCRLDLRSAAARRDELRRDVDVARARLEGARQAAQSALDILDSMEAPEEDATLTDRLGRLRLAEAEAKRLVQGARERWARLERKKGAAQAEARVARREADAIRARLVEKTCTKCGQSVEHQHADVQRELEDAERRAAFEEPVEEMYALEAERQELEEELEAVSKRCAEVAHRLVTNTERRSTHARAVRAAESAKADLEHWSKKHDQAYVDSGLFDAEVGDLEVCERVLGLRGVRATMLDRALTAVQVSARAWLRRLGFAGSIDLRSSTERKSGAVVDAISLEVTGAGGGKYRGASAGERRRIDLAVLFALMEVAQASRGGRRGTLWVDEAADSLDEDGREAFAQAMSDLAQERCVVVITHERSLAERMPAAVRLRVEAGTVVRES